jgi:hypothetical protein
MNNNDERDHAEEAANSRINKDEDQVGGGFDDEADNAFTEEMFSDSSKALDTQRAVASIEPKYWVAYDRCADRRTAVFLKSIVKYIHPMWLVRVVDNADSSVEPYVIQYKLP